MFSVKYFDKFAQSGRLHIQQPDIVVGSFGAICQLLNPENGDSQGA